MSITVEVDNQAAKMGEIELQLEEIEEVIAPGTTYQHNETLADDEVELSVEEIEAVIAPRIALNDNQTLLDD